MSEPASHPAERLLSAYLDGGGGRRRRRELEAHLEGCGRCRDLLERLRSLDRRLDALADREPPRDLWPELAARIRAEPGRLAERRTRRWRPRPAWLVPAAGLAGLLAVLALWTADRSRPPGRVPTGEIGAGLEEATGESVVLYREAAEAMRARIASGSLPRELEPVVDAELAAFDAAIVETRAALERSPGDPELERHLLRTLRAQVRFLQRTDASASAVF